MFYLCADITDQLNTEFDAKHLCTLSGTQQYDYRLVEGSALHSCLVHDGASDCRADKCSASGYHRCRERLFVLCATTTGKKFM